MSKVVPRSKSVKHLSCTSLALSMTRQTEVESMCLRRARDRTVVIGGYSSSCSSSTNLMAPKSVWQNVIEEARHDDVRPRRLRLQPQSSSVDCTSKSAVAHVARENWKRAWRRARQSLGGAASRAAIAKMPGNAMRRDNTTPFFAFFRACSYQSTF